MTDLALIALALRKLDDRLWQIAEEIGCLLSSVPGDPGTVRWPPMLERELEDLEAERALIEEQIRVLSSVERQLRNAPALSVS